MAGRRDRCFKIVINVCQNCRKAFLLFIDFVMVQFLAALIYIRMKRYNSAVAMVVAAAVQSMVLDAVDVLSQVDWYVANLTVDGILECAVATDINSIDSEVVGTPLLGDISSTKNVKRADIYLFTSIIPVCRLLPLGM